MTGFQFYNDKMSKRSVNLQIKEKNVFKYYAIKKRPIIQNDFLNFINPLRTGQTLSELTER